MKAFMITLDIIAVSIMLWLLFEMYVSYWREKNRKRTPYDREQERLMKTYYPDDPEQDFDGWKKYITDQRNAYINEN